ncbi:glycerol uptake protein 1 [Echria macrotheca]|uniref:Glycerol uptake protein 1 n=1 Tax=Echria macrotheca TaxID=438768 RepID=A0AAJ0FD86_9PEZI|nr:glycerol uptake protein 1 [Echria macrotheca]
MAPGILSFFRGVYDLDTLDTRLTTSSTIPYTPQSAPASTSKEKKEDGRRQEIQMSPSKWGTPEFYLYYLVFILAVPYMFWVPYTVSRPSDPRYHKYEQHLSDGWIPGRKIDVSDAQYHLLRENFSAMAGLLLVHPLLRKGWNHFWNMARGSPTIPDRPVGSPEVAEERMRQRVAFDFVFALVFLFALHGFSAAKVLLILGINYKIATQLPRRLIPATTWIFNIGILLANEIFGGYKFRSIAVFFAGEPDVRNVVDGLPVLVQVGEWLDRHGGLMSRWEVLFNITVLRLISFNMDYYWSLDQRGGSPVEKKQLDPANLSERDRVSIPAAPQDFSFRNYVGYAIYAPLYLTGPILTFNDYMAQQRYRAATIETPRTLRYGVRFLLVVLSMELVLHFDYVGAISKADPDWSSYTPAQLSLLSFMNLHIIWLKLLLPWRFFRLWALVDGIDPPENMVRCVSNNFSTLSFWRSWHRSYNRFLLRYIYIPMGGANFRSARDAVKSVATYLMVFTFVALWHDIQMRLLIWGWLVVLFFLPEIAARNAFPKRKWEARPTAYRMLCCVGAVGNILMMIAANLVGFAVGADGLKSILVGIFREYSGLVFLVTACAALFVGVQVMFEIREAEKRRGVNLKF